MSGQPSGLAFLPGFVESLRLLVERERYSMTDIALMFGVSRERIRQLFDRYELEYPEGTSRGLNAVRVWDDASHRFRPVSRGSIDQAKRLGARAVKRAKRVARRAEIQQRIVEAVTALRARLGRDPSWWEMWLAIGGSPDATRPAAAALAVGQWMFPCWDEMVAIDCLARLTSQAAIDKMRARYAEYMEDQA